MENTDRAAIFGRAIRDKRKEQRLTVEAAAKKIGISKQYLSVLERAVPSLYTGKSIVPKLETVDSIAEALNWNIDEARLAAGYAPTTASRPPQTLPELIAALESLGIESPMLFERLPPDPNGEAYREVIERIWESFQLVIQRVHKTGKPGYVVRDITLTKDR